MRRKIVRTAMLAVCVFGIVCGLCACRWRPLSYPFPNKDTAIAQVELMRNDNPRGFGTDEANFVLLKTLDSSEASSFMEAVYVPETKCRVGGPLHGYGPYFARVTYTNGDVEYLGCNNIELISENRRNGVSSGNTQTGFGSYHFNWDEYLEVFFSYAPQEDDTSPTG